MAGYFLWYSEWGGDASDPLSGKQIHPVLRLLCQKGYKEYCKYLPPDRISHSEDPDPVLFLFAKYMMRGKLVSTPLPTVPCTGRREVDDGMGIL